MKSLAKFKDTETYKRWRDNFICRMGNLDKMPNILPKDPLCFLCRDRLGSEKCPVSNVKAAFKFFEELLNELKNRGNFWVRGRKASTSAACESVRIKDAKMGKKFVSSKPDRSED